MACRLNPKIVDEVTSFAKAIGVILVIALCFTIYIAIFEFIVFTVLKRFELYEFASTIVNIKTTTHIETINDLLWESTKDLTVGANVTLFLLIIAFAFIAGICSELKESYNYNKDKLEYKFQKKVPWYRVLINYIVICDKPPK